MSNKYIKAFEQTCYLFLALVIGVGIACVIVLILIGIVVWLAGFVSVKILATIILIGLPFAYVYFTILKDIK